ncbi:MAG: TonB-dependent receptor [Casimicrobiaceae bacterium]|nr:TonB-dependent receptor [Casimicrobiaceae bacterium]MDW8311344.1 TonB-dependent receptor [Burkholderiales bacterium]
MNPIASAFLLTTRLRPAEAVPHVRTTLSLAVAAALAASAGVASAQTPSTAATTVETVTLTGQRESQRRALAIQTEALTVQHAVSADEIGALPDKNVAEAVARLPGVAVQRDQGEGRYVVVRGLAPELNAVSINGVNVVSPENGTRAVSLDVLPSGLIGSIRVHKTFTPEQDSNALGGLIDVRSLSAFDLPAGTLSFDAAGSYDENLRKVSPSGSVLWADRLRDGRLGVVVAVSGERRRFGSDNVETGGQWNAGRLAGWELRDYQPTRTRNAVGINLDWRPHAGTQLFLRGLASRFTDSEIRDRLTISNIVPATGIAEGQVASSVRAERRLRDREYTRSIDALTLGGEHALGDWTVAAQAALSRAGEKTPEQLNDARFRQNGVTGVSFTGTEVPILSGPAALTDPSRYSLNAITLQRREGRDREQSVKLDITRRFALGEATGEVKFGGKLARREKNNDTEQWSYSSSSPTSPNYWGPGSTSMSAFVTGNVARYPFGPFGPTLSAALVRERVAALPRAGARNPTASATADFELDEDTSAAYVQGSLDWGVVDVLAGARFQRTEFTAAGFRVSGTSILPTQSGRKEDAVLPALHARVALDRATQLRAALTQSAVRPNFDQLSPGIVFGSATEVSFGNPELKSLRSTNLDLGIERKLGSDGVVSLNAFEKRIRDFTYQTNLAGTGPWVGFSSATTFVNGDTARLRGLEFSYADVLKHLPAPFNGLLVGVNATLTESKARVSRFDTATRRFEAREIRLPGQSRTMLNLVLGYEQGPWSLRLALNHKSPYLLSLGSDILDAGRDLWVDRQNQVDLSIKYQATRSLQVSLEVANLNDEKYYVYQGSRPFNAQYERYGRTVRLGVRVKL